MIFKITLKKSPERDFVLVQEADSAIVETVPEVIPPVVSQPTMELVPNHGAIGTPFTIKSKGWEQYGLVNIYSNVEGRITGIHIVNADGSFEFNHTVPAQAVSPYEIRLQGWIPPDEVNIYAPFAVSIYTPPPPPPPPVGDAVLKLSPTKGGMGTEVTVTGENFGVNNRIMVTENGFNPQFFTTDETGAFYTILTLYETTDIGATSRDFKYIANAIFTVE